MENRTKSIIQISLAVALLSVGALVKIPISVLPITLQPFFLYIIAFSLGKKKAVTATSLYAFIGLLGIPVFANGGGLWYIVQPSFGFILGFIAVAFISGTILEKVNNKKAYVYILTGLFSEIFLYIIGLTYMFFILKFYMDIDKSYLSLIVAYCLPYLPCDILSIIIATVVTKRIAKYI